MLKRTYRNLPVLPNQSLVRPAADDVFAENEVEKNFKSFKTKEVGK